LNLSSADAQAAEADEEDLYRYRLGMGKLSARLSEGHGPSGLQYLKGRLRNRHDAVWATVAG
jgi:hypothetical protein